MINPHYYSIDINDREKISYILAILSVLITWSTYRFFLLIRFTFPWWSESPTLLVVYGFLSYLCDKYILKVDLLRKLGIIQTPYIGHTWRGYIRTTRDNFSVKHPVTATIQQTLSKILITTETHSTTAQSYTASFIGLDSNKPQLIFCYINTPKQSNEPSMIKMHRGTSIFELCDNKIMGYWYNNGNENKNYGTYLLKR